MEELQGLLDIRQQDLEVNDFLGNGCSGAVFRGVWRSNGKEQIVAIKKMQVTRKEIAEEMLKELKTMQSLQSENICKVYGGCIANNGEQVWLVMEYVDGGDLHKFLAKYGGPLPKDLALSFCIQATKALVSLHSAPSPILHRDIKSPNFLVQNKRNLLLTDFGLSKAKSHITSSTYTIGTVRWAAPEILSTDRPQWCEKADIYSLGMVFYEIITRNLPYQEDSNLNNIIKKIKSGTLPKLPIDCPKAWISIIQSCLTFKSGKRPTASELLAALESLAKVEDNSPEKSVLDPILLQCCKSAEAAHENPAINPFQLLNVFYFVRSPKEVDLKREREFVYANLPTLLWWLVNHDDQNDRLLSKTFLYTATSFTTPFQLFETLVDLYLKYIFLSSPFQASFLIFRKYLYQVASNLQTLHSTLRIALFVKMWVELLFFRDFKSKRLVNRYIDFTKAIAQHEDANLLKLAIIRANKSFYVERGISRFPTPKVSTSVTPKSSPRYGHFYTIPQPFQESKLLEWDISSVAEQFTCIEFELFKAVKLQEISNLAWKAHRAQRYAPNVLGLLNRFDLVCQWVSTEVVMAQRAKQRVAILERLILLAQKCFELRNYNSLAEIMSGLNSGPVQRLKLTWEAISSTSQATFKELAGIVDARNNYKTYREHLTKSPFPCLPFFGVFLRDLSSISETPSMDGKNVHFEKVYQTSKIFKDVMAFQLSQSAIYKDDDILQPLLRRLLALPEAMQYKHSHTIEPISTPSFPPPAPASPKLLRKTLTSSSAFVSFKL